MSKITAAEIISQYKDAIKDFGTYTFDDKGADEVMDIRALAMAIEKLPAEEAAKILVEVAKYDEATDRRTVVVASDIVMYHQEWEELFKQPGIEDIYDRIIPGSERSSNPTPAAAPSQPKVVKATDLSNFFSNAAAEGTVVGETADGATVTEVTYDDMMKKLAEFESGEVEEVSEVRQLKRRIRELENICVDASVAVKSGMELPDYLKDEVVRVAKEAEERQNKLTSNEDRDEQGLLPLEEDTSEFKVTIVE
jgi:hypothetical protein